MDKTQSNISYMFSIFKDIYQLQQSFELLKFYIRATNTQGFTANLRQWPNHTSLQLGNLTNMKFYRSLYLITLAKVSITISDRMFEFQLYSYTFVLNLRHPVDVYGRYTAWQKIQKPSRSCMKKSNKYYQTTKPLHQRSYPSSSTSKQWSKKRSGILIQSKIVGSNVFSITFKHMYKYMQ